MVRRLTLCALLLALFLLPGCRGTPPAPMENMGEVCRMEDGAVVSVWQQHGMGREFYKLDDGAELLMVSMPSWPWNTYTGGLEGFDGMSEQAQEAVRAYYGERGLLYDVEAVLAGAYADYTAPGGQEAPFRSYHVEQSVAPSYETERFTIFTTILTQTIPAYARDGIVEERRSTVIFDRTTGAVMEPWELFTVPEAEAKARLFDLYAGQGVVSRETLERVFRPEYLEWSASGLSLFLPAGTADPENPQSGYAAVLEFQDLAGLIQPWAVSEQGETD